MATWRTDSPTRRILGAVLVAAAATGVARADEVIEHEYDPFMPWGADHLETFALETAALETNTTIEDVESVSIALSSQFAVSEVRAASVTLNMGLRDNTVEQTDVDQSARIEGSGNDNAGLVGINQDAGNVNNQTNVVAVALGADGNAINQVDVAGSIVTTGNTSVVTSGARVATMDGSFNDTLGVAQINQNAGNLNQQANIVAVAMGIGAGENLIGMSDRTLETMTSNPDIPDHDSEDPNAPQLDTGVNDSFHNFVGVAQVGQMAGDGNIATKTFGVSARVVPAQ